MLVSGCKWAQENRSINDVKSIPQSTTLGRHRLQPENDLYRNRCLNMVISEGWPLLKKPHISAQLCLCSAELSQPEHPKEPVWHPGKVERQQSPRWQHHSPFRCQPSSPGMLCLQKPWLSCWYAQPVPSITAFFLWISVQWGLGV